jgi:hypothetical protein
LEVCELKQFFIKDDRKLNYPIENSGKKFNNWSKKIISKKARKKQTD